MHAKTLTLFAVLSLAAPACAPTEPVTTDPGTTEAGPSTGATTGTPTTDTPTTDTPTTEVLTTGGDSESATGTTGDESTGTSTGSVEPSTGGETSTGDASTGDTSTGEPAQPVSFAECRQGDAEMCPAEDPACLVVDGPGGFEPNGSFFVTWSYCTRECEADEDCVSGVDGGTAVPRCVEKGANMVKVCVLDCSFGKSCPDALECSYDDTCATRFCECEGSGCQDKLCTGE
jgi:hypothetical protein